MAYQVVWTDANFLERLSQAVRTDANYFRTAYEWSGNRKPLVYVFAWRSHLRKTENEWKKLVTMSKNHGVKDMSGTSHWFIFAWTHSVALRNWRKETTCTCTYGRTKFLSDIAITGTYASHVRVMCKTYQSCPYLWTSKRARGRPN